MNRAGRVLAAAAVAAVASVSSAQNLAIEKYTLPNGMTVILHEDHSRPVATINTWFRVGSKDEPAGRSGFAHLFEHLMFMGTERVPGNRFDMLMEVEGGWNNASTGNDRTNYFSVGPASILPTLLWLDADRLEDLPRTMDQKKVDLQRDVVLNELRQNVENEPYGRAELEIQYLMYPPSHPYHFPTIGSEADLKAASVTDVKDFFATFYHASNASLVVAGDFDPAVVKPLVADLFGSLPRRPEPTRKPWAPVKLDGVKRGTVYDAVQLPMVSFCYHSPAVYAEGDAECDLLAAILADGKSSRLYRRLVAQDRLATSVHALRDWGRLGTTFRIDVLAGPGVDLDLVEEVFDEEVARLSAEGPTPAELDQYKASIEFHKLEEMQDLRSRADKLNEYQYYLGEPNSFERDLDRYRSATAEGLRRWSRLVLTPAARVIFHTLPLDPRRATTARDTRPADWKTAPFSPPLPTESKLSSGISLLCWQIPGPAVETITVVFAPGGALTSPDGADAGFASLTARMLSEGAGDLDAFEFARAVDSAGASFETSASAESVRVAMTFLARNADRAVQLLGDAVRRPRFRADDFDRVRKLALDELRQSEDEPRAIAPRVASRALYGSSHPLAWPLEGTPATISRAGLGDVQAVYHRFIRPETATILAAGSLSPDEVRSLLERALGDWHAEGTVTRPTPPAAPAPLPTRVLLVDRPGAPQTLVRFEAPGVSRSAEPRVPLQLVNTILGASFTSRLNQNLRENKGYTYGARSGLDIGGSQGSFTAGAGVTTAVTGASLKEFLAEFARLKSGDITEEEAGKARKFYRQKMLESLEGTQGLTDVAADLLESGAPFASLGADDARAASLHAADLNAAAGRFDWTDHAVLVLVGDKATILEQLTPLNLPAPVEVDAFGDPVAGDPDPSSAPQK